ncbi:hypothetical protein [Microvirga pudoricolor]|uniref:hypothetical protein n=1 Tax=Microvirga pudoricolor TaxID=2778729 RepID=UPI0019520288|nr:hypothetical protein [Microvirga pudoricolor]MBM6595058.1 hypothetical protein [Microvirga pudoricolor]
MSMEFYVVRHHGAWRIRVNGKHQGEYGSRILAINAAVSQAQTAGPGAKVFSTGIVSQFTDEWQAEKSTVQIELSALASNVDRADA